ncbi:MAG: glycosyl transferase, group 1 [Phycisphaerales bacterium]|nr:glycosyl transferase, group 1 [Phycisphaerales bacterium]
MPRPLDILAIEPFYGGVRRAVLECVARHSRHRWRVLKLPPRRIERRLAVAANWFGEHLGRHAAERVDLLLTSEALNLANLLRLVPALAAVPTVVYFHDNQLLPPTDPAAARRGSDRDGPLDLVNLNSAQAATEVWFNSVYHRQAFFALARAVVDRHPELAGRDPLAGIRDKARLVRPPVDVSAVDAVRRGPDRPDRRPRTLFVDTRDAHVPLLNAAVGVLRRKRVAFDLLTVGPTDALDPLVVRKAIPEHDDAAQLRGMFTAAAFLSVRPSAPCDYQALRALAAGCRPVLPSAGVYPELLPPALHAGGLYPVDPTSLADRIALAVGLDAPAWYPDDARPAQVPFDPVAQCKLIDDRLDAVAAAHAPRAA